MMVRLTNSVEIHALADKVWAVVGDLAGIGNWISGMTITHSRVEGNNRICTIEGMGELHEEISDYSDEKRSYRYTICQEGLPFKVLRSKIQVQAEGKGSRVVWEVEFEPAESAQEAEVTQMLDSVYKQSLESLRKRLE